MGLISDKTRESSYQHTQGIIHVIISVVSGDLSNICNRVGCSGLLCMIVGCGENC